MAKYLDESGVQTLWTAVKKEDTTIKTSLETKIGGLTLEYSVGSKEIHLKRSDGTVQSTIDVTSFVKDGMLKSVTVLTASLDNPVTYKGKTYSNGEKFLRFEWNADSDDVGSKVNILKMDEIAPVYSGSSSIDIELFLANGLFLDIKTTYSNSHRTLYFNFFSLSIDIKLSS